MSVKQFLQDFKPGSEADEDTFSELSGLSNEEAERLAEAEKERKKLEDAQAAATQPAAPPETPA